MFASPWSWFIIGCLLMALEALIPGVFILWIGVAAIVVGLFVSAWPEAPLGIQFVILAVAIGLSLWAGLTLHRKRKLSSEQSSLNSGLQSYIGSHATAITTFNHGQGRVRLDDSFYSALCSAAVTEGDAVRVVGFEGSTLIVEPA
ncbi:NfeD family protein [Paenalcaligenes suwonensis]|uniref:NfeD family protein n=1 Tax=Paenalcaligenes suwonensis TaxID=1202713 RepID=UPI00140765D6|nr:NfeD family protein [Paenalcaligenes suwonensis]NHC62915.1 NfeD family protein [Paenalcaligenes suwonensis]